jgi:hypothetical protein
LAATTTRSPQVIQGRCKRQISRNLRRIRLRVTAPPRRRGVIRPKRVSPPAGSRATLTRNKRPCAERPCDRTRANSRLRLMRTARGNPSLSGFGVPGVRDLDTLGQQAFATALAAAAQNRAAALRFHSSAKTELALARALAGLVGAFHKSEKWSPLEYPSSFESQFRNPSRTPLRQWCRKPSRENLPRLKPQRRRTSTQRQSSTKSCQPSSR